MSVLAVRHLAKRYRSRYVVNDVSLTVASGEVVGLLGPNGAGKSTSFYMIVGLVGVDGGTIELNGEDVTWKPVHVRARLGLGYLPQEPSVFRKLTVRENLLAVLELRRDLRPEARAERADDLMLELHVHHLADQPGVSLSGGERRRVEIARALAAEPRLMLLDEPFAGVDPLAVVDIQRTVAHLKERGIGVLITDHNVRETLGICDRAYIVSAGRTIAEGTPEAILQDRGVREAYLGETFRL
jgi:lipopolysaccharide export system ATP-binding protein